VVASNAKKIIIIKNIIKTNKNPGYGMASVILRVFITPPTAKKI